MKKVKTVTRYTANVNFSTSTDVYLEPQAAEEEQGEEPLGTMDREALLGPDCTAGMCGPGGHAALARVVMKDFSFVEIAGCGREDVMKYYEEHFAKMLEHGVTVDREGRIRWEDAKEIARICAEEDATQKAEEGTMRRGYAEEEAMLAAERAAVETRAGMELDVLTLTIPRRSRRESHVFFGLDDNLHLCLAEL